MNIEFFKNNKQTLLEGAGGNSHALGNLPAFAQLQQQRKYLHFFFGKPLATYGKVYGFHNRVYTGQKYSYALLLANVYCTGIV